MPNHRGHRCDEKSTYSDHFQAHPKKDIRPAGAVPQGLDEFSLAQEGPGGEWQWPVFERSKVLPKGGANGEPAGQKHLTEVFDVHTLGAKRFLGAPLDHPGSVVVACSEAQLAEKVPVRAIRDKAAGRPQQCHVSGAILGFTHTGMMLVDKAPSKNALQPDVAPIVPWDDANAPTKTSAYKSQFSARPGVGPEPVGLRTPPHVTQSPQVSMMAATTGIMPAPSSKPRTAAQPRKNFRPSSNPRSGPVPGGLSGPPNGVDEISPDEARGPKLPLPAKFEDFPWVKVENYIAKKQDEDLAKIQIQTRTEQASLRSELDQQATARRQQKQKEKEEEKRFHASQEAELQRFKEHEDASAKAREERVRQDRKQLDAQVRESQKLKEAWRAEKLEFERKTLRENEVHERRVKEAEMEKQRKVRAAWEDAWLESLKNQADKKGRKVLEKAEDRQTAADWTKILEDRDHERTQDRENVLRKHQPIGAVEPYSSQLPTKHGVSKSRRTDEVRQAEERALQEQKVLDARDKLQEETKKQKLQKQRDDALIFNQSLKLSKSQERQRIQDKKEEIRAQVEQAVLIAKQEDAAAKASVRAKNVAHRQEVEKQINSRPPPGPRDVMSNHEARLNRRLLGLIEASEAN